MKRVISILFLAAIFVQSFSSLYVIASFYINRDYVSQNLCVNRFDAVQVCKGKCYLTSELKQQEQKQEKLPDLKQKEITVFIEDSPESTPDVNHFVILSVGFATQTSHYYHDHLSSVFHPPLAV